MSEGRQEDMVCLTSWQEIQTCWKGVRAFYALVWTFEVYGIRADSEGVRLVHPLQALRIVNGLAEIRVHLEAPSQMS